MTETEPTRVRLRYLGEHHLEIVGPSGQEYCFNPAEWGSNEYDVDPRDVDCLLWVRRSCCGHSPRTILERVS